MKPIAGLNRDVSLFNQPENTYTYASNAMISESMGDMESIPRDLDIGAFPVDFLFMGWAVVADSIIAVGFDPSLGTGEGQIWELVFPLYVPTLIVSDPDDTWELSQDVVSGLPVAELQFAWSKDSGGQRQIIFSPINTQPKFVNIDQLAVTISGGTFPIVLDNRYTRKAFLLFPEAYLPPPECLVEESGGSVKSGCYFFFHQYEYIDGSSTDWSAPSNPAYIVADTAPPFRTSGENLHGDEGGRLSPKSIDVLLDLDDDQPPETFVRLAYVSYRGGVIFAAIMDKISFDSISTNNGHFLYSGQNPDIDLGDDISEIITPKAHYKTVGTLTALTNRLYVGNLVEAENLLYQNLANEATISWCIVDTVTPAGNKNRIRNKTFQVKVPTFGPGEVYAFYLHFLKNDGTESRAFHIPGRKYASAAARSAGSYTLTGVAAGDGVVGLTVTGGSTYNHVPVAAETAEVASNNLVILINGDGAATIIAQDTGSGTFDIFWKVPGIVGDVVLIDNATDTGLVSAITGLTGGADSNYPGVPAYTGDDIPITMPNGDVYPKYRVQDTIVSIDDFCGYMGYWANPDENYPLSADFDGARDVSGSYIENVRHHRFPTLKWLWDNTLIPGDPDGFPPNMDNYTIMDITVDVDLSDPKYTELVGQIEGFYISYAKKTVGDTINVGTQVMVPMATWGTADPSTKVYKPNCGPWGIGPWGTGDMELADDTWRWHGLNMVQNFTSVNPQYIDIIRCYENHAVSNVLIGDSQLYWPPTTLDPTIPGARISEQAAYRYGILESLNLTFAFEIPNPIERVSVEDFSYVRNGTKLNVGTSNVDNMVGEDALVTTVIPDIPPGSGFFFDNDVASIWRWYFGSLMTIPTNIAYPFTNQTLVYCGFEKVTGATPYILIGAYKSADFFHAYMQFNTTGPVSGEINTTTDEHGQFAGEGMKIGYQSLTVSPFNHNAQYFDPGDFNTYISPIQGQAGVGLALGAIELPDPDAANAARTWHFWDQNIYQVQPKFYNNDFNRLREFFVQDIYDGVQTDTDQFPVTIAFSLQQISDSPVANWRTWLVNNKYTQPVYAGDIINLEGAGNQKLYIHHRYSLFITKDRTTLKGTQDVTLGSSDIFEVTPFEVVTTEEGHTGIGRREWQDLNIMGYCWVNHDHGKVYLHNGQELQEISSKGMRIFFREFIDKASAYGSSFSFTYDEDRKRLLLTCFGEALEQRFTLSYSSMTGAWVSFHDDAYFNAVVARDKTVLFRKYTDNPLINGGITPPGVNPTDVFAVAQGIYGDYENFPFIVEVVANQNDVSYKYVKGIMWSTNSIDELLNIENYEDTFKEAFIYTSTKTSGALPLVPYLTFPKTATQNIRRLEKNWFLNEFRDLWDGVTPIWFETIAQRLGPNPAAADPLKPWYEQGRLRDKTFIVRLTYDQTIGETRMILSSIEFDFKQSKR